MREGRDAPLGRLFCCGFLRQHRFHVCVRASDNVDTGQVAFDGFDSLGTGVRRRFNGGHVADHHSGDQGIADLRNGAGEFDIRRLEHRVGPLDEGH